MSTTIEQLELEVQSSATSAVGGIDALASSLGKLKTAVKGGVGLTAVAKQLTTLNTALNGISAGNADNLNKLAQGLQTLSSCGNLKLSSSVATQITNIGNAVKSLSGTNFSALNSLANALTPLTSIGKANLNSFISQLQRLPQAVQALSTVDMGGLSGQISQLVSALAPLTQMGKNNLTSFITQLRKIPQVMTELRAVNMGELTTQTQQLANAFAPLASQMQSIANGFAAFPARIQRLIQSTNSLSSANNRAANSYTNLAAKIGLAVVAIRRIATVIASWITESNKYIENLNLFTVSMGEYADKAREYAERVGEVMGIDPGEWMRNQGIFMTLATGFGVVSDRAYTMSQNLTQLGYDLSSFFNISFEDAMQKLQSGISGELEPLRRLGYDLSVARLQQEAYTLGIEKKVTAMTQAEKAELRYYAIMTQVTSAQGDMARTLEAPANQLRILQAQVTQCARALGNIFIPVLNAVLPYAIAVAKVIRMIADAIASLFGFALPQIDYSSLGSAAGGAGELADNLGEAGEKAKEVKNALLGIDELNIISPPEDSGGGAGAGIGGGGGLGFELPTYDFIGDAVTTKVDEIVQKMKEWLGLTEDIDSWSEFFHTRLGRILTTIGAIALGLAAWKISKKVLDGISYIKGLSKMGPDKPLMISMGVTLAVTGIALEWSGIIDAIQNELNGMNFAQIIGGGGLTVAGGALIGKALGSAILGGGIAGIVAGLPAFGVGIYDAITKGLDWLNGALIGAGATAAGAGIGAIIGACGGPIGAGIGALIGLAVGLVTDGIILIVQKWDVITEFLSNFFTVTVPGLWSSFTSWLSNIPKGLGKFFNSLPGKISAWFDELWRPIQEYDWSGLGYNIGQWFGNAWKTAVEFVTVTIPTWFSDMWNSVKNAFSKFFTQTLPTFFTQTIPKLWETIKKSFVTFFTVTLPNALSNIGEWFVDVGQAIWDGICEGWNTAIQAVKDFVNGFVQGFKDALGIHSPSTVFAAIGNDIVAGLLQGIEGFTNMLSTVSEWAGSVVEWFRRGEDGMGIVEHFKQMGGDIITGFKDKVGSTYNTAKTNITTWAFNVKEWFTNSSFGGVNRENFSTFANNIIEGFRTKVNTAYTNVKSSITTWASNVKNWFTSSSFGGVNSSTFLSYATNIVDGFKNRISNYYTAAQSAMNTFGSKVKSWFTDYVSYSKFYSIASDVVEGFKNGIGALYQTCKNTISSWGSSIIAWFKDKLDSNSPSKVFMRIGEDTILGYNLGISALGNTTKGVVNKWADSFTSVSPVMSFAVDTSALRYYSSDNFAKSVSANVTSNTSVTATGFKEGMEEFYREYIEPTMAQMASDMRRQADKNEQTVVQIGNRTVTDAVTTQQKANGFRFTTA